MKRIIRGAVRRARQWLKDDKNAFQRSVALERARFRKFAYGELNARLLEVTERNGDSVRPNYTWGVLQAAHLAKALGIKRISAIEFGVAGGNGLIALETAAEEVGHSLGVEIDVYGFDTGKGLPKAKDYRDLPNLYTESTYSMDQSALKARLKRAKLILGLIETTLAGFLATKPAPVGFVAVDVDLYTSTQDVFKLFETEPAMLLPRIHCHFDDITGFTFADFNGERLAMKEFNENHAMRKISPIYGLRHFVPISMMNDQWIDTMYLVHVLDHELYCHDDGLVLEKQEHL
jgi:hypothetical protein